VKRRTVVLAGVIGWILVLTGAGACLCWLASLREDDNADRITILQHFGRPGWDWYVDFLRGQLRFVVKDYDILVLRLAVPGWSVALVLMLAGASLWVWNRRQALRVRGFELRSTTPKVSQSRKPQH